MNGKRATAIRQFVRHTAAGVSSVDYTQKKVAINVSKRMDREFKIETRMAAQQKRAFDPSNLSVSLNDKGYQMEVAVKSKRYLYQTIKKKYLTRLRGGVNEE